MPIISSRDLKNDTLLVLDAKVLAEAVITYFRSSELPLIPIDQYYDFLQGLLLYVPFESLHAICVCFMFCTKTCIYKFTFIFFLTFEILLNNSYTL